MSSTWFGPTLARPLRAWHAIPPPSRLVDRSQMRGRNRRGKIIHKRRGLPGTRATRRARYIRRIICQWISRRRSAAGYTAEINEMIAMYRFSELNRSAFSRQNKGGGAPVARPPGLNQRWTWVHYSSPNRTRPNPTHGWTQPMWSECILASSPAYGIKLFACCNTNLPSRGEIFTEVSTKTVVKMSAKKKYRQEIFKDG